MEKDENQSEKIYIQCTWIPFGKRMGWEISFLARVIKVSTINVSETCRQLTKGCACYEVTWYPFTIEWPPPSPNKHIRNDLPYLVQPKVWAKGFPMKKIQSDIRKVMVSRRWFRIWERGENNKNHNKMKKALNNAVTYRTDTQWVNFVTN